MTNDDTIDLLGSTVTFAPDGAARAILRGLGPPVRVEGLTVGAPLMTRAAPHGGEMHPDGDELLYVISGRVAVTLEDCDPPRRVELAPGQAFIVPKGVWHAVELMETSRIVHVTPGPRGEHRPLAE